MSVDLQPTEDQVLQEEPAVLVDVPVRVRGVDGPVRVQELPRKAASAKTWPKLTSTPVRVLTADPYRAKAVLTASVDIYVSYVAHGATESATSGWWPAGVPFECTATVDIYARCAYATQTAVLSVFTERWATGSEHGV